MTFIRGLKDMKTVDTLGLLSELGLLRVLKVKALPDATLDMYVTGMPWPLVVFCVRWAAGRIEMTEETKGLSVEGMLCISLVLEDIRVIRATNPFVRFMVSGTLRVNESSVFAA